MEDVKVFKIKVVPKNINYWEFPAKCSKCNEADYFYEDDKNCPVTNLEVETKMCESCILELEGKCQKESRKWE